MYSGCIDVVGKSQVVDCGERHGHIHMVSSRVLLENLKYRFQVLLPLRQIDSEPQPETPLQIFSDRLKLALGYGGVPSSNRVADHVTLLVAFVHSDGRSLCVLSSNALLLRSHVVWA